MDMYRLFKYVNAKNDKHLLDIAIEIIDNFMLIIGDEIYCDPEEMCPYHDRNTRIAFLKAIGAHDVINAETNIHVETDQISL